MIQSLGYGVILILLWWGGNVFVRAILRVSGALTVPTTPTPQPSNGPAERTVRAGRYIGGFERSIVVLALVLGSRDLITAVFALKTIARYKELESQIKAEYYLIGSLGSIFWAVLIAGLLLWYDSALGFRLLSQHGNLHPFNTTPFLQQARQAAKELWMAVQYGGAPSG